MNTRLTRAGFTEAVRETDSIHPKEYIPFIIIGTQYQRCRVLETQSQKLRVLSDGHDIVASVPIKKALKDIGARGKDRSTISSKFPSR